MTTRLEHIAAHAAAELRHHSELLALIADVIDELASRARLAAPLERSAERSWAGTESNEINYTRYS